MGVNPDVAVIGMDRSVGLAGIAGKRGFEVRTHSHLPLRRKPRAYSLCTLASRLRWRIRWRCLCEVALWTPCCPLRCFTTSALRRGGWLP